MRPAPPAGDLALTARPASADTFAPFGRILGVERQLRTPAHFQREVGKTVSVRLRDPLADPRRLQGSLVSADDRSATVLLDDGTQRSVMITEIDKARTVFEWGPKPKPANNNVEFFFFQRT